MPAPVNGPIPEDLDLPDGYIVQWNAIDPVTGLDVAGVVVTNVSIFGTALGGDTGAGIAAGPFMLVPGPGA